MGRKLESIIITGASGFVGRNLLDRLKHDYKIFAIARRSRKEAEIPYHQNISWVQWDISSDSIYEDVRNFIKKSGGADYVVHLAGFYDFKYDKNPEYQRTNVEGTNHVLKLAKALKVKRFIFASSIAACKFPSKGEKITERTPPNASFAYAKSKKDGEINVNLHSNYFPCSIVRFAAVFSDWCEYAPLYKFLETWLTKNYASRILAGRGESGVPYIHIHDLCKLISQILKKSDKLKHFDIYNASPVGSATHKELFSIATRDFYGRKKKALYLPKFLAYPGVLVRNLLGIIGFTAKPFEKLWMVRYIDDKLDVDASYTRKALNWEPTARYHVLRRLLFLLVNLKSHPAEWHTKNEAALKHPSRRPNWIVYEQLLQERKTILTEIEEYILEVDSEQAYSYQKLDKNQFRAYLSALYHLLMASVRSGDRSLVIKYIDDIALHRFSDGFELQEILFVLDTFNEFIVRHLVESDALKGMQQQIYDFIGLSIQIAKDEVEDIYENLEEKLSPEKIANLKSIRERRERRKTIRQLSAFYQQHPSG